METSAGRLRRRAWRWARFAGVAALLVVLGGYTGLSILVADRLTAPTNHTPRLDPRAIAEGIRPWTATTADGVTLRGYYAPTGRSRRLVVLVHGMWSSWAHMAGLGRDLHARGYNVLLFDLRGHGRSDPARLTMGRLEREDLRAVLAWAEGRGYDPGRIGWVGHSLGASTILMEGAGNPKLRAAVLDSAFGDLPALLGEQLPRHSHLPGAFNPGILTAAHWAYGVRIDDLIPLEAAPKWGGRPLLVIHGEADSTVPVAHALRLARTAGPSCRALVLPGVEHVGAYNSDPDAYVAAVDRFFDRHLGR